MWNGGGKRFTRSNGFWYTFSSCLPTKLSDFILPPATGRSQFCWAHRAHSSSSKQVSLLPDFLPASSGSQFPELFLVILFVSSFACLAMLALFDLDMHGFCCSDFMFHNKIELLGALCIAFPPQYGANYHPSKKIQIHGRMKFSLSFTFSDSLCSHSWLKILHNGNRSQRHAMTCKNNN